MLNFHCLIFLLNNDLIHTKCTFGKILMIADVYDAELLQTSPINPGVIGNKLMSSAIGSENLQKKMITDMKKYTQLHPYVYSYYSFYFKTKMWISIFYHYSKIN